MRNAWYAVMFSGDLKKDRPSSIKLFGDPLVLFRDHAGMPACFLDSCPHRMVPLSLGKICEGAIECAYHGWRYDGSGRCVHIPLLPAGQQIPRGARAHAYPAVERGGAVWVWPGDPRDADAELIPLPSDLPPGLEHAHSMTTLFPTRYDLLMEHVLDIPHFFSTHPSTLLRYLPRPRAGAPEVAEVEDRGDDFVLKMLNLTGSGADPVVMRVFHPCHLSVDVPLPLNRKSRFMFFHAPIDEAHTRGFMFHYRDFFLIPAVMQCFNWVFASIVRAATREDMDVISGQMENVSKRAATTAGYYFDAVLAKYHKWQRRQEQPGMWFDGFDRAMSRYGQRAPRAEPTPAG